MAKYKVVLSGIQWDLGEFDFGDPYDYMDALDLVPEEHECIVEADSTMEAVELAHDSASNGSGWLITDVIEIDVKLVSDLEEPREASY